jgi:hypothetical protein
MAKSEIVLHWIEGGSNSMTSYQALMGVKDNPKDTLSVLNTSTTLVATVSNIFQILQPIRIVTNGLVATSALTKIVVDWQDSTKTVQAGDILTLVSATGTIAVTLLFWAEAGPGAAAAISAVALAADLQSSFQPYISSAKIWMGNLLGNVMQISNPVSSASSSLYWGSTDAGTGYKLYSYDEIMGANGFFVCMSDDGTAGEILRIKGNPVPGSLNPINESQYRNNYCKYLYDKDGGSDWTSWSTYCPTLYK